MRGDGWNLQPSNYYYKAAKLSKTTARGTCMTRFMCLGGSYPFNSRLSNGAGAHPVIILTRLSTTDSWETHLVSSSGPWRGWDRTHPRCPPLHWHAGAQNQRWEELNLQGTQKHTGKKNKTQHEKCCRHEKLQSAWMMMDFHFWKKCYCSTTPPLTKMHSCFFFFFLELLI